MSQRDFGIPVHQRLPRRELLSPFTKDFVAAILTLAFIGIVVSVWFIEFPNGLADLRQFDIKLVSQGR